MLLAGGHHLEAAEAFKNAAQGYGEDSEGWAKAVAQYFHVVVQ